MKQMGKSFRGCQIGWCAVLLCILLYHTAVAAGIHPEALAAMMPSCLMRTVLGLYCPGCGGTRAVILLLEGHPIRSFFYHPVVLYAAVLGGWYLISNTIAWLSRGRLARGSRYHHWYGIGAAVLVAFNWVIRNFLLLVFHITL